jgi:hypothetical protein
MAGCAVQYRDGSAVCVAVGNNLYSGAFIYLIGSFASPDLVPRSRGALDLADVHRARVTLDMRGTSTRWIAPFEALNDRASPVVRGRLTGFLDSGPRLAANAKPVRDFRGWLWQNRDCADAAGEADCLKRTFFSIRLPVETFREALFQVPRPVWPPKDLDQVRVRVEVLAPGSDAPLFDSNAPGATPPFSLTELSKTLLPGETCASQRRARKTPRSRSRARSRTSIAPRRGLRVSSAACRSTTRKDRSSRARSSPRRSAATTSSSWRHRDRRAQSFGRRDAPVVVHGRDARRDRAGVAGDRDWPHTPHRGAHEARGGGVVQREAPRGRQAHRRARRVSDLRGSDELGILAGGLSTLLQRVKDDVKREHIRAQQERDMWHAVGHEIMSPLQSLIVLHGSADDPSHRYVQRMQLPCARYTGRASPSEALEAATLEMNAIDLNEFLRQIRRECAFRGIEGVEYAPTSETRICARRRILTRRRDTHILRNADRYPLSGNRNHGETPPARTTQRRSPSTTRDRRSMLQSSTDLRVRVSDSTAPAQRAHRDKDFSLPRPTWRRWAERSAARTPAMA